VEVRRVVGEGDDRTEGRLPLTPRLEAILRLARDDALAMRHDYVGSEHLLIASIHEGGGVALHVLDRLGAPPEDVWASVYRALGADQPPPLDPLSPPVAHALLSAPPSSRGRSTPVAFLVGGAIFALGVLAGRAIRGPEGK
jgi:hypothetical protein